MEIRDHKSIRSKLISMSMLTSASAVLMACVAYMAVDVWSVRDSMLRGLDAQANMVAFNSASALQFNDPDSAAETLASLRVNPGIRAAAIYLLDARVFAQYRSGRGATLESLPDFLADQSSRHDFSLRSLVLVRPLHVGGQMMGAVYLQSDLSSMYHRLLLYAVVTLVVSVISLMVGLVQSTVLQRAISGPIVDLTEVVNRISIDRDYSVPVRVASRDEVGKLASAFNDMLEQISQRDAAIRLSEERYRSLVSALTVVVWNADASGDFVSPQELWERYTGQTWEGHQGAGWKMAFHPDDREPIERGQREASRFVQYKFEGRLWNAATRAYRHVEVRAVPLLNPDGTVREWVGTVTDDHDRKIAEAEIRKLNAELELRVAHRTIELQAANTELEAFCYSVSHDLRAPVRSIDGFSEALVEDCGQTLTNTGRRHIERIQAAARRMGQLIEDLLNLSRVTRAEITRKPVDLSEIAHRTIAELRQREPRRQVSLAIQDGIHAHGDARLLSIVLENLLGNAWKFTGLTETPEIQFGARRDDGETVYFVKDNGAGFDMAYADKLFGAFQRLHGAGEFSGTGIGLATVQRIVHRHGGRIRAEAKVGEGAVFYFTLGGGAE